jgi:hypothetical protein
MKIARVGAHQVDDHLTSCARDIRRTTQSADVLDLAQIIGDAFKSERYFDGGAPVAPVGLSG